MPTAATLNIELVNHTSSNNVYAYVTGLALDRGNAWFLLSADGTTGYYPQNPPKIGSPLAADVSIKLASPGQSRTVTIPRIAGGRIYLSVDKPLTFFLNPGNPGPALVEPSVTNPSDPNINIHWGFCEFTYNSDQLYANISYVDFVSVPIAISLLDANGQVKSVAGIPKDGLTRIATELEAQSAKDKWGWKKLIVRGPDGQLLRVHSPNQGKVMDPNLLRGYYDPYVDQVLQHLSSQTIYIETPGFGRLACRSAGQEIQVDNEKFGRPLTRDIFSANSGPFVTGSDAKRNGIIPRLNAEFNRSTLLTSNTLPAPVSQYYKAPITNHYARVVHAVNIDGRGYAHPYDDATPPGGPDQSGFVNDGNPKKFTITVGGPS